MSKFKIGDIVSFVFPNKEHSAIGRIVSIGKHFAEIRVGAGKWEIVFYDISPATKEEKITYTLHELEGSRKITIKLSYSFSNPSGKKRKTSLKKEE